MIEPVRPQDASGIYRQQVASIPAPGHERTHGARRSSSGGRRADQIHLSDEARELHRVVETVAAQPEERAALVAALRRQIADGTYRIDARAIARRLLAEGRGE